MEGKSLLNKRYTLYIHLYTYAYYVYKCVFMYKVSQSYTFGMLPSVYAGLFKQDCIKGFQEI